MKIDLMELAAQVAVEVMEDRPDSKARFSGCNEPEPYIMRDGFPVPWIPKPYPTDWSAAGEVLEKLDAWDWQLISHGEGVTMTIFKDGTHYEVTAPTAPLAICLAALKAVRSTATPST